MQITDIIQLLGGLAVFLFGMKTMSEALQDVAGSKLKNILSSMTTNRFTALISGILLTILVQSSSATTVMLVGFVNAGLLSLVQGVGVVMGANIGTTVTAWIVSLLGFKINIMTFALPAVVLGVAALFSGRSNVIGWGRVLIGFGFLFLGLDFMKNSVPDAAKNPEAFVFLQQFSGDGIFSVIKFIAAGSILTIVVQSSSAASAITLTLAFSGYIPIEAAYGMILGENIGTTVTANIAALAGNSNAKKTAIAHTFFNLVGVAWVMVLFYPFIAFVDYLVPGNPLDGKSIALYHIAAFHTAFNLINTTLLIGFVRLIASLANRFIDLFTKEEETVEDAFKLLESGTIKTGTINLQELKGYIRHIIEATHKSLSNIKILIKKDFDSRAVFEILENEKSLDLLRSQLVRYLSRIQEAGVSGSTGVDVIILLERIQRLEQIGDQFARIARKMKVADRDSVVISKDHRENLLKILALLEEHYGILIAKSNNLDDHNLLTASKAFRKETKDRIIDFEDEIRKTKKKKKQKFMPLMLNLDITNCFDQISHYLNDILQIAEEVTELND